MGNINDIREFYRDRGDIMSFKAEQSVFKGSPTLTINDEDNKEYPRVISFGVRKAKAILECIEELKAFVELNKSKEASTDSNNI